MAAAPRANNAAIAGLMLGICGLVLIGAFLVMLPSGTQGISAQSTNGQPFGTLAISFSNLDALLMLLVWPLAIISALLAVIFGHLGLNVAQRYDALRTTLAPAIVALVMGYLVLAFQVLGSIAGVALSLAYR
jgi:hypothetical protein